MGYHEESGPISLYCWSDGAVCEEEESNRRLRSSVITRGRRKTFMTTSLLIVVSTISLIANVKFVPKMYHREIPDTGLILLVPIKLQNCRHLSTSYVHPFYSSLGFTSLALFLFQCMSQANVLYLVILLVSSSSYQKTISK